MPQGGVTIGNRDTICFAEFELDLQRLALYKNGIGLKLQPQPLRVLALLLTSAPEIVSRERIRRHVWGDRQYIEADQSINFCIRQIRSVLGDSPAEPRFLETLPREGYRFIGIVESLGGVTGQQRGGLASAEITILSEADAVRPTDLRALRWTALLLSAAALIVWATFIFLRSDPPLQVNSVEVLTTEEGIARDPALAPDRTAVVFAWTGEDDGVSHIYMKGDSDQEKFALTHGKDSDRYPVWSPDGKSIAFARVLTQTEFLLMRVSTRGGQEELLRKIHVGFDSVGAGRPFAWTADGRFLCFADQVTDGSDHLFLLSLQNRSVQPLRVNEARASQNESGPAFSPDGHSVAITRSIGPVNTQIVLQQLDDRHQAIGRSVVISGTGQNPSGLVWLDHQRLAFLDGKELMQASWEHPTATQIYAGNMQLSGLDFDPSHRRFITSQSFGDGGIWALPLKGATAAGTPRKVVESLAGDAHPAFSPDGKFLAFVSSRSGSDELWLADADGQSPRQLTHMSAYVVGYPRWSPDSKQITFHARVPRVPQLYVFRLDDHSLRKLTGPETEFVAPSFSSDGTRIYCMQLATRGAWQIAQIDLQDGTRKALWPGEVPFEAPGRSTLVYASPKRPGFYERSLRGDPVHNPEVQLLADPVPSGGIPSVTANGIFYVNNVNQGRVLRFYSFAKKQASDVTTLDAPVGQMLSLKPDGTSLAYDTDSGTNAQLIALDLK